MIVPWCGWLDLSALLISEISSNPLDMLNIWIELRVFKPCNQSTFGWLLNFEHLRRDILGDGAEIRLMLGSIQFEEIWSSSQFMLLMSLIKSFDDWVNLELWLISWSISQLDFGLVNWLVFWISTILVDSQSYWSSSYLLWIFNLFKVKLSISLSIFICFCSLLHLSINSKIGFELLHSFNKFLFVLFNLVEEVSHCRSYFYCFIFTLSFQLRYEMSGASLAVYFIEFILRKLPLLLHFESSDARIFILPKLKAVLCLRNLGSATSAVLILLENQKSYLFSGRLKFSFEVEKCFSYFNVLLN